MKTIIKIALLLGLTVSMAAQAGTTLPKFNLKNEGKKIAVVSFSVNNHGGALDRVSGNKDDVIQTQLNKMLTMAENKFAENKLTVIPVKNFVAKKKFQLLAGDAREVELAVINGVSLPLMASSRKQLVKCRLDKDKAIALTKVTGADFVAVIYSEWTVKTGRFVPTSKALAKNVIGIYDNKGNQVYFGRSDKMGNQTLGGMGYVKVTKDTIGQWAKAYSNGLDALFAGKK